MSFRLVLTQTLSDLAQKKDFLWLKKTVEDYLPKLHPKDTLFIVWLQQNEEITTSVTFYGNIQNNEAIEPFFVQKIPNAAKFPAPEVDLKLYLSFADQEDGVNTYCLMLPEEYSGVD